MIFGRFGKARPELRLWLRGTFLACSALAVVGFWWTSIRETEVNERIVTGVPASQVAAADLGVADPLAPQPETRAAAAKPARARNVVELGGRRRPRVAQRLGPRAGRQARARRAQAHAVGRLSRSIPGPQVRVYLATDASGKTYKDLGALKGSKGNQQYAIPAGT